MHALLKTLLLSALLSSANAEWKMHSSGKDTFIYNTVDGEVFYLQDEVITQRNVFPRTFIPLPYKLKHATPKNYHDSLSAKPKRED